jgi:pimeloyl-ACP methyl ester carboxylesterase
MASSAPGESTAVLPPGPGSSEVGDIVIGYEVLGEGPPLVMITGFGGTMDMWDPTVLSLLADRFTLVLFDNRGMGLTSSGDADFSIERFADDTAGLMEALGLGRADVLAWSMGTEIALELALRHPGRVDCIVLYAGDCGMDVCPPSPEVLADLYDTSGTPEERGYRLLLRLFPGEWLDANLDYVLELFSGFGETSPVESVDLQAAAMDSWPGAGNRLGEIDAPVLLLTGSDDVLTPPENSLILLEGLPRAELVEIEGGGHGVMYQYPDEFAAAVLTFLEGE